MCRSRVRLCRSAHSAPSPSLLSFEFQHDDRIQMMTAILLFVGVPPCCSRCSRVFHNALMNQKGVLINAFSSS